MIAYGEGVKGSGRLIGDSVPHRAALRVQRNLLFEENGQQFSSRNENSDKPVLQEVSHGRIEGEDEHGKLKKDELTQRGHIRMKVSELPRNRNTVALSLQRKVIEPVRGYEVARF